MLHIEFMKFCQNHWSLLYSMVVILQATSSPDETDGESALLQAVADLPQPNRDTLAFLILHLRPGHPPQYFPLFITADVYLDANCSSLSILIISHNVVILGWPVSAAQ
jgi:hypothetical protein